jgi:hypothetical protein
MKKIKYVKPTNDKNMILLLQNAVLAYSNAGLISISIHRLCKKFVQDLKEIPLSEELQ